MSLAQKAKTLRELVKESQFEDSFNESFAWNGKWVRLEDAEVDICRRDTEFETRVKTLGKMMADELIHKERGE